MNGPEISVVMSVYNGLPFLKDSIESILNQTYKNFEFIIIDDVSNDGSSQLIREYAHKDNRIVVVENEKNYGHIALGINMAKGVSLSKGKYVARMDSDDIAVNTRFELQKKFLDDNPDIDILGTWAYDIDENGVYLKERKYPVDHASILKLMWTDPIVHPSVMLKKDSIIKVGNYADNSGRRDDYELWFRAVKGGLKFANYPHFLMYYRFYSDYYKKNNSKVAFKQAIIGFKGCLSVGTTSPIPYFGVFIPWIRSLLPGKMKDWFHTFMFKLDPRRS